MFVGDENIVNNVLWDMKILLEMCGRNENVARKVWDEWKCFIRNINFWVKTWEIKCLQMDEKGVFVLFKKQKIP